MSQALHVLYIGPVSGTCLDRANAMRRLGHRITHIDPRELLPRNVWIDRMLWRLGGHWLAPWVAKRMKAALAGQSFDLGYVDNGEWISPMVIRVLRQHCPKVINYNIDDPTGSRDMQRFAAYRRSVRHYDLVAVVREDNLPELQALGARRVLRVWRSSDELTHAARPLTQEDHAKWDCDVLFLGTWMPERGPFLLALVELGVPLTIQGAQWQKAPEWLALKAHWRGGSLEGDDYAKAIQCAKVNLGLLSKGNRDLHTTRSLEIPALAGLFCAERTSEHMAMYEDGVEAVFWSDAKDCAQACIDLLADEPRRMAIAHAGHVRHLRNGHRNEVIMAQMLNAARG